MQLSTRKKSKEFPEVPKFAATTKSPETDHSAKTITTATATAIAITYKGTHPSNQMPI